MKIAVLGSGAWGTALAQMLAADGALSSRKKAGKLGVQMILLGASERSLPHRVVYGNRLERILRDTACDVGIYRRP